MTLDTDVNADDDSSTDAESHRTRSRRRIVAGILVGLLVGGGLVTARLMASPDQPDVAKSGEYQERFPSSFVGDVWITVFNPAPSRVPVVIAWGSWSRTIEHQNTAPVSYRFKKTNGGDGPALRVTTDPTVAVTFGYGTAPAGALDVNDGWIETQLKLSPPPAG